MIQSSKWFVSLATSNLIKFSSVISKDNYKILHLAEKKKKRKEKNITFGIWFLNFWEIWWCLKIMKYKISWYLTWLFSNSISITNNSFCFITSLKKNRAWFNLNFFLTTCGQPQHMLCYYDPGLRSVCGAGRRGLWPKLAPMPNRFCITTFANLLQVLIWFIAVMWLYIVLHRIVSRLVVCTQENLKGNLLWWPSCCHVWRYVIVHPDFFCSKAPSKCELRFRYGLESHTHITLLCRSEPCGNDNTRRLRQMIAPNP